jgi:hypothetical protein
LNSAARRPVFVGVGVGVGVDVGGVDVPPCDEGVLDGFDVFKVLGVVPAARSVAEGVEVAFGFGFALWV